MSSRCSICNHIEREAIDEAIVSGSTMRDTARRFGVGKDAVSRHKAHVSQSLSRVVAAREEAGAKRAVDRAEDLYLEANKILAAAQSEGKASLSLAAVRELRGLVELLAKMSGELDERPTVQVLNVATAPEWVAIRGRLMQALASHPEAARDVAIALGGMPVLEVGR